ncbi:NAD-dependent epimerase [Mycobacterium sp. NS-7484]|uniref:SDR family oxidoreductase n=1 Tax=unclassified Mycobacterium TaxID=2642494 RepID=UPI0007FFB42D|nr:MULTISPECIES: SDR family oxidoreductase [unclassified Mycobacterium]OBG84292.1 NAD-dependent epimerase [Mycobacterium sp. E802]OMB92982.1 NAD-dependent epimerase [Mycobacterium sp. NS-7484]
MATYVLTGSASGIGAATKTRLESDGHRVIGVDLRDADVNADLSTADGRAEAIAKVTELAAAGLDGFVPFAGLAAATGRPADLLIAVNYFGAIELLEGLRPLLARAETASVVLISSNSTTTQPNWPAELAEACLAGDEARANAVAATYGDYAALQAYPATKAALAYYARTKSAEYVAEGIRLNAIAPGLIDTPMTQEGRTDPLTGAGMEQFLKTIPAGRGGRPEEVAALVAFLLGPEAGYFVGSVIFVDGGIDAALRGKDWPRVWQIDS